MSWGFHKPRKIIEEYFEDYFDEIKKHKKNKQQDLNKGGKNEN